MEVQANFDNKVDTKNVKFHFKKDQLGNKRDMVELDKLPVPSVEGIVEILQAGGKQLELLLSAVAEVVIAQARSILNDNETMTAATFPLEQLSWEAIASMPEAEKRGRGIPKELWEQFANDYITVMPALTGKTAEQVGNAAKLFINKFQAVKTNKQVLGYLQEQLAIYISNSSNAEEFADCVKFLNDKAETLLAADDSALLNNL